MATRAVTDEQLQGIADAIKLKSGDDTPMSVDDMALRIGLIEGGGGVESGWIDVDGNSQTVTINHGLGKIPDFIIIQKENPTYGVNNAVGYVYTKFFDDYVLNNSNYANTLHCVIEARTSYDGYVMALPNQTVIALIDINSATATLPARTTSYRWQSGKYKWMAF